MPSITRIGVIGCGRIRLAYLSMTNQFPGRAGADRGRRRQALVSAAVLAGPESDREDAVEGQAASAFGSGQDL